MSKLQGPDFTQKISGQSSWERTKCPSQSAVDWAECLENALPSPSPSSARTEALTPQETSVAGIQPPSRPAPSDEAGQQSCSSHYPATWGFSTPASCRHFPGPGPPGGSWLKLSQQYQGPLFLGALGLALSRHRRESPYPCCGRLHWLQGC